MTKPAISLERDRELLELRLLAEALYQYYDVDFRDYAPASFKRRVWHCVRSEGLETISGLQERVLHDPACKERLMWALSVKVTSMFRNPSFYATFRNEVVPFLRTYPFVRVWHAGCSTGEEVYSMAILLLEEGLYNRCRIYATDLNETVLRKAEEGILPLSAMRENTKQYQQSEGRGSFSDFYVAKYDRAILSPTLRRHIVFARHNLATEASFNEFNVILCRNVMIYFNGVLQTRVHNLLYESLGMFGFLGLGSGESIQFTPHADCYKPIRPDERLYRKVA